MTDSKIPLCRAYLDEIETDAAVTAIRSGWLTHGPSNIEFERQFADYIGVTHAISVNSCTSALFLSVLANGISGEVIVPSFTFVASANAIVTAGATPVFIDINYHDCNINPSLLEISLTPRTEAIMPVHYAGQCCQMDAIAAFAQKHGLAIIEDSAETIGGTFHGKKSGAWGTGCYSFFPTKNLTCGEGGMVTTNDDVLARKMRTLLGHGLDKSTMQRTTSGNSWERAATLFGYNFRLSNILAAIGVEQMKKLDAMNALRRIRSFSLTERLRQIPEVEPPAENTGCEHVFQMFTIKVEASHRDALVHHLRNNGVEASVHFTPPVHRHPAYHEYAAAHLPVTDEVAGKIITLPMFPGITEQELDIIASMIERYFGR